MPATCVECNESFSGSAALSLHKRRKHAELGTMRNHNYKKCYVEGCTWEGWTLQKHLFHVSILTRKDSRSSYDRWAGRALHYSLFICCMFGPNVQIPSPEIGNNLSYKIQEFANNLTCIDTQSMVITVCDGPTGLCFICCLGHTQYILRSTDPDRHIFALSEEKK